MAVINDFIRLVSFSQKPNSFISYVLRLNNDSNINNNNILYVINITNKPTKCVDDLKLLVKNDGELKNYFKLWRCSAMIYDWILVMINALNI